MIVGDSFLKSDLNNEYAQKVYQLIFLNTENQTVEAWETNYLEVDNIIRQLRAGGSVFISPKRPFTKKSAD